MNNKGNLSGLRESCIKELEQRAGKLTDAQKLKAWNHARGVCSSVLNKITQ